MKILHRSVLKELILTFILSLASLNFILMTEKLLRLSRVLSGVGISVIDMAKLILYLQPQLLLLTIPMAFLLSTLLVYGRLNMDNELVIMKMSGMDFKGISAPVAVLGMFCFLVNIAVSFYIGPKSTMKLREETMNIIKKRTPLAIEEGRFNTAFKDILILVKEKPSDNTVREIFLYDNRNSQEPRVLMAREGVIAVQDGLTMNLFLRDGYINMVTGESTTEVFFKKYNMTLRLESGPTIQRKAELTPYELIQEIGKGESRRILPLYFELYRRFSVPLMCIILIFFGPPLAMTAGKSGRLGGLTIGLAVFTAYYMLLIYSENLVRAGKIPHEIGAWIATVILGIAALLVFRRESRR
ncbi:MAG: permease, YjgP/YjgQ family [Nitrospirae bacterium]|nr:permease, YjgP/YjgQ family [Nitrospirota bacterium]